MVHAVKDKNILEKVVENSIASDLLSLKLKYLISIVSSEIVQNDGSEGTDYDVMLRIRSQGELIGKNNAKGPE